MNERHEMAARTRPAPLAVSCQLSAVSCRLSVVFALAALLVWSGLVWPAPAAAQVGPQQPPAQPRPNAPGAPARQQGGGQQAPTATTGLPLPSDYVIGPDDVLGIVFWRDTDMTGDVTVRPDGNITLPLIRDVRAVGLTPDQLRESITKAAAKFIADPNVTVVVRQINSRNVFITGLVARPGPYPMSGQMNVLQLISLAGGLTEFANGKRITIMRTEASGPQLYQFNYNDVLRGKKMEQNIILKPGDTVLVP